MLIVSPLVNSIKHLTLREQYNELKRLYSKPWFGLVECCNCAASKDVNWRDNPELWKLKGWITYNIILNLGNDSPVTTGVKVRIATGMLNKIESLTVLEKIRIHDDLILTIFKEQNAIIDEELPF